MINDLQLFTTKLSRQLKTFARDQSQQIYTIDQLAKHMQVSTKTVSRWRTKGLLARRFIFKNGEKKLGFLQSSIDFFLSRNRDLVAKAKNFNRLNNRQKQKLIDIALEFSNTTNMSRHQIIKTIASKMQLSHETVRYTLINYSQINPKHPEFNKQISYVTSRQKSSIYKCYRNGMRVSELTKKFHKGKSSIYRIINRKRAEDLLGKKIEFIDSPSFHRPNAQSLIFKYNIENSLPKPTSHSHGNYLQLNRSQEKNLFKRYNYLKYLALKQTREIHLSDIKSQLLKKIESNLEQAQQTKTILIEASLKLVIAVAKKHFTSSSNRSDLIGDGNMSLMSAVEKFDYTKGFRFSTYARWIIVKDFAKKLPAEYKRLDKASGAMNQIEQDLRIEESFDINIREQANKDLISIIKNELVPREQHIIINHFGLIGTLIRKERKTLQQIGQDLGITKERTRQLELHALQKLRQSLSIEQFEQLTTGR